MKRMICFALLLALCVSPLSALAAKEPPALPKEFTVRAGQFQLFKQSFTGVWESSDPAVAGAEPDVNDKKMVRLIGFQAGEAILTLTGTKTNKTAQVKITVLPEENAEAETPELLQKAVEIGLREWEELGGKSLPQEPRNNKYTKWWGYACGWCGAFAGYCLDTAGVPLESEDIINKRKPLDSGAPHGVKAAGVPKLNTGYTNMGRVTKLPRPGYLVIYGSVKDSYGYKHVGLVTDVQALEDGKYLVSTVEGNMSSTVKRYCYVYDARNVDHKNMASAPQEVQTDARIQYNPHQADWYVTEFCMTWY